MWKVIDVCLISLSIQWNENGFVTTARFVCTQWTLDHFILFHQHVVLLLACFLCMGDDHNDDNADDIGGIDYSNGSSVIEIEIICYSKEIRTKRKSSVRVLAWKSIQIEWIQNGYEVWKRSSKNRAAKKMPTNFFKAKFDNKINVCCTICI